MQRVNFNFDLAALRLEVGENMEISYTKDLPKFVSDVYENILQQLGMNSDNLIPEVIIKLGYRTDSIMIRHNPDPDIVGRFVMNMGPDENIRLSKIISGKHNRQHEDVLIHAFNGFFLDESYNSHDVILSGNPRRVIDVFERSVSSRGKPTVVKRQVTRIRPSNHVSVITVINLTVNMESKLANEVIRKQTEGPGLSTDTVFKVDFIDYDTAPIIR
jgi:hypothetical protein